MKLEFLTGQAAEGIAGRPLEVEEAYLFVNGKQVKTEVVDLFDSEGSFVRERPTGSLSNLLMNIVSFTVEPIEAYNEHVDGLRVTDRTDPDNFIELALIPMEIQEGDSITTGYYISERLSDSLYCRPSEKWLKKARKENKSVGEESINEDQSN